jgi:hypothetical protein
VTPLQLENVYPLLGASVSVTMVPSLAVQLLPEQLEPVEGSDAATVPPAEGEALPVTAPWSGVKLAVSVSLTPAVDESIVQGVWSFPLH